MKSTKWRLTVITIACVVAYYADDDGDLAKGNTAPASCVVANQTTEPAASSAATVADRERECALIRNTKRHAQV